MRKLIPLILLILITTSRAVSQNYSERDKSLFYGFMSDMEEYYGENIGTVTGYMQKMSSHNIFDLTFYKSQSMPNSNIMYIYSCNFVQEDYPDDIGGIIYMDFDSTGTCSLIQIEAASADTKLYGLINESFTFNHSTNSWINPLAALRVSILNSRMYVLIPKNKFQ